jgi:hypothetical protein
MRVNAVSKSIVWLGFVIGFLWAAPGLAQFKPGAPETKEKLGESAVQQWQAGVAVRAVGGPCRGIVATVPIPMDWPEQEVKVAKEEIASHIRATEKTTDGIKQMMFTIANLPSGEEAKAVITFEITKHAVVAPKETAKYALPDSKDLDRTVRPWLNPSPMIESQSPRIMGLAKEVGADKSNAWAKVEAIYDYAREKVKPNERLGNKGALAALQAGSGNHEDQTRVFIALCRAAGIAARTIWVDKYCYAEFYLVDGEGKGSWFPCTVSGNRSFGGVSDLRPILEKGDNFHSPDNPRERLRYLPEHLTGAGGRPQVNFIRKLGAN